MFMRLLERMGYTKEEASWILYDVGNSAQVLTTCTVIFPLLIAYITPGDSSVYVGWANTVYGVLLAVMSPILGTVADYKGMKMKLFPLLPLYRYRRWFCAGSAVHRLSDGAGHLRHRHGGLQWLHHFL